MFKRLQQSVARWYQDDAGLMAAAVAYYVLLSLVPLLLVLTSGIGFALKWTHSGHDVECFIFDAIGDQLSPALAEHIHSALQQVEQQAAFNGPIGFLTLALAAMAMFMQFERAFSRIWGVESTSTGFRSTLFQVLTHRLRATLLLIGVGFAIVLVFIAGIAFETFQAYADNRFAGGFGLWWSVEALIEVCLNAVVIGCLYRFLPPVRVQWSHSLRGGLFASVCWEFGRQLLAGVVISQHYSSAYGLIGSVVAIMLWAYYACSIVFLGAEYTQLLGEDSVDESPEVRQSISPSVSNVRSPSWKLEIGLVAFLIYVATFLGMRHFGRFEVHSDSPRDTSTVVVFSRTPDGQQWCKLIFSPLIATLPGDFRYPNARELPEVLSQVVK